MGDIDFEDYIGRPTAHAMVTVERAPVSAFATSVLDDKPLYQNAESARSEGFDDIPAPPTFLFSAASWSLHPEEQPPDPTGGSDPMAEVKGGLMANGGLILHGEQSFEYHRPVVVGEKLEQKGVVKDLYEKPTGDRTMTFLVVENTFTDEAGEPVVTATMNLIHRS